MMITANNGFIEQSERYAFDNAGESLKKYILLQKGELAYNHGASKLRPFGSCFALTTAESARIPFVYHCFSAENQNAEFLSIELNGSEVESQLRKIVSSGARMDGLLNISFDEYSTVTVLLPDIKEQEHIADFFRNLDHLITLHQRKYDKLQVLKKAMLEKMFPKNGSSVPEIRFKGFTDAWEQRKLGEFFEKYQNTVYLQDEEEYRQISIRNTGVVEYRCTNKGKNIGRKRQYLIDTDTHPVTLTFTRQTVYEGGIGFVPKELNGAIVTENMPLLEMTNASQDFMKALFNTSGYYKSVINDDTLIGSAQKALHEKQWLDSYVCIPVLDEQKQIGSFFQQLEHLITLHQRELEKLQNIKKSMLEKMFV